MERMATILLLFVSVNVLTTSFMVGTRGSFPSRYFSTSTVTKGSMTVLHSSITEAMGRSDFPILETDAHPGKKLIFLDSAASSQKPHYVLNAMDNYYKTSHANVHRGAHALAVKATEAYENAREHVRKFVNAGGREEIIFTRGATDAINLVALSWTQRLQPGDEIILTEMEHHSNLVPWQMAAQRTGAILKFVHMNASMEFNLDEYYSLLSPKTKLVAVAHASNVLGEEKKEWMFKPPTSSNVSYCTHTVLFRSTSSASSNSHSQYISSNSHSSSPTLFTAPPSINRHIEPRETDHCRCPCPWGVGALGRLSVRPSHACGRERTRCGFPCCFRSHHTHNTPLLLQYAICCFTTHPAALIQPPSAALIHPYKRHPLTWISCCFRSQNVWTHRDRVFIRPKGLVEWHATGGGGRRDDRQSGVTRVYLCPLAFSVWSR